MLLPYEFELAYVLLAFARALTLCACMLIFFLALPSHVMIMQIAHLSTLGETILCYYFQGREPTKLDVPKIGLS